VPPDPAHTWDVQEAAIEFTDARYARRFSKFPLSGAPAKGAGIGFVLGVNVED
jgi:hypothetical protein